MGNTVHRGIISIICRKRVSPIDIHAYMVALLGDDAPALSSVQKWAVEFKRDRESLEDDPRSGRPAAATIQGNIDRIHYSGDGWQTFNY